MLSAGGEHDSELLALALTKDTVMTVSGGSGTSSALLILTVSDSYQILLPPSGILSY